MPAPERQRPVSVAPAAVEDHLFRSGVVRVRVDIVPEWRQSPQGYVMLRGYIGGKEIEVVFPGRRRAAALQLAQRLKRAVEVARATADKRQPNPGDLRQTVHVDGVWRVRLLAEVHGMPVRRFQLVAARWRYRGSDGVVHVDGEVPYG